MLSVEDNLDVLLHLANCGEKEYDEDNEVEYDAQDAKTMHLVSLQ